MRNLRILGLTLLLSVPAGAAGEPVAIVYSLTGEASSTAPERRPLRLFDRLPAGTIIEVGPGSRLALAFTNGLRYELGERSRVMLGLKDLTSRTGLVRPLPRLPPIPLLSPIAAEDRPGPRAGAVRIRAERITGLYPRSGAAVLPGEIFLHFQPVTGAGRYRVEVQDDQGRTVHRADVEVPEVLVPDGILRSGASYHWTVRTLDRPGAVAYGEAAFITLPQETARSRESLRAAIEATGDSEALSLLAAVDLDLGLLLQAREGLRTALQSSAGSTALDQRLATLERLLQTEDPDVSPQ